MVCNGALPVTKAQRKFWENRWHSLKSRKNYNKQFPGEPLAATGNTKLSNWQNDKVKLDKAFADYLISLIRIGYTPEE